MKLSLWKHPRTGETRLYIEGVGNALKVWLVQSPPDAFGGDFEIQSNGEAGDIPSRFRSGTADRIAALWNVAEKALAEAGLPANAKWNDLLVHLGASPVAALPRLSEIATPAPAGYRPALREPGPAPAPVPEVPEWPATKEGRAALKRAIQALITEEVIASVRWARKKWASSKGRARHIQALAESLATPEVSARDIQFYLENNVM